TRRRLSITNRFSCTTGTGSRSKAWDSNARFVVFFKRYVTGFSPFTSVQEMLRKTINALSFFFFIFGLPGWAATVHTGRYAVLLEDPPVATQYPGHRGVAPGTAAFAYRQQLETTQQQIRGEVERRGVRVTGAAQHVLNAVFIKATPREAA